IRDFHVTRVQTCALPIFFAHEFFGPKIFLMALLEKHLYVKKSTLPNSGKGLFTKVFIPKGTRIVEYKGRRTVWKDVKDDDGKNRSEERRVGKEWRARGEE